jgi:RNA polymerase sigma-70 factor (ECF subfamily)
MDLQSTGQVSLVEAVAAAAMLGEATSDFAELFDAEEAYVLRSLRRLGVHDADVEDVAHEVFLLVHAKLAELDGDRPVRPWLFAFCFRMAANHRRKARRSASNASPPPEELADPSPRMDERLEMEDDRRLVLTALEILDLDRRAVFVMHCLDEIPIPEVAATLGIPLGTAYTRLRAAKQLFVEEVRRLGRSRDDR